MSNLFLILIYIERIRVTFLCVGWVFFVVLFCTWVILLMARQYDWYRPSEKEKFLKDVYPKNKNVLIFCVLFFILGLVGAFIPSKSEMITFYVISQVDDYNKEHKESVFNPDNLIGGTDEKIKKISDIIDKSLVKIESFLDKRE